jgi:hypothetical protein
LPLELLVHRRKSLGGTRVVIGIRPDSSAGTIAAANSTIGFGLGHDDGWLGTEERGCVVSACVGLLRDTKKE